MSALTRAAAALLVLACVSAARGDETPSGTLLDAAARGDRARLSALLAGGADPDARDDDGSPALVLAVESGQAGAVRVLLREGADAEAATRSGWTALHAAAEAGVLESTRVLLDAGVEVNRRDRSRGTALDVAEQADHDDVARLLRERGAEGSGKSVGDIVCVRRWSGDGFCAVVVDRDRTRHQLRVTGVVGCDSACEADRSCSAGEPVGPGGLAVGDNLWVATSCLTHTGLR